MQLSRSYSFIPKVNTAYSISVFVLILFLSVIGIKQGFEKKREPSTIVKREPFSLINILTFIFLYIKGFFVLLYRLYKHGFPNIRENFNLLIQELTQWFRLLRNFKTVFINFIKALRYNKATYLSYRKELLETFQDAIRTEQNLLFKLFKLQILQYLLLLLKFFVFTPNSRDISYLMSFLYFFTLIWTNLYWVLALSCLVVSLNYWLTLYYFDPSVDIEEFLEMYKLLEMVLFYLTLSYFIMLVLFGLFWAFLQALLEIFNLIICQYLAFSKLFLSRKPSVNLPISVYNWSEPINYINHDNYISKKLVVPEFVKKTLPLSFYSKDLPITVSTSAYIYENLNPSFDVKVYVFYNLLDAILVD